MDIYRGHESKPTAAYLRELQAGTGGASATADPFAKIYDMILGTLDTLRFTEPGRPVSLNLEDMHGKLKRLFAPPPHDLDAASQTQLAWRAFSDGLLVDASLKLESNPGENPVKPAPVDIAAIAKKRLASLARLGG